MRLNWSIAGKLLWAFTETYAYMSGMSSWTRSINAPKNDKGNCNTRAWHLFNGSTLCRCHWADLFKARRCLEAALPNFHRAVHLQPSAERGGGNSFICHLPERRTSPCSAAFLI